MNGGLRPINGKAVAGPAPSETWVLAAAPELRHNPPPAAEPCTRAAALGTPGQGRARI